MPEAELRRQREAYRRGAMWATSVSAAIILALGLLSVVAIKKSYRANLAEAKAWRSSGQMGQRINALKAIHKAKTWGALLGDSLKLRKGVAPQLVDLEPQPPIDRAKEDVVGPELNRDFSRYAVADREGKIRIVSVARNQTELELGPIGLPVLWLRFGHADDYLAVGYGDEARGKKRFLLWRLTDSSETKTHIVDLPEDVQRDGWDIIGKRLAVGLSQHKIWNFSLPSGERLPSMAPPIPNMAQAPVSASAEEASFPETLRQTSRPEARRVSFLRFDPSGLATGRVSQAGSFLYLWNFAENKVTVSLSRRHRGGRLASGWPSTIACVEQETFISTISYPR
jgi:hypothetical protein